VLALKPHNAQGRHAPIAHNLVTPDTPSKLLPLGFSASYWLDLRAYAPVATAAGLTCPMLVLQGGRDYQVTVADDLVRRRNALVHRPEVTIRIHQDADHLFFPGGGHSAPAEYARPGHVEPAVVDEITAWLSRRQPTGPVGQKELPGDRRPLRQARLSLPGHRHRSSTPHPAPHMTGRTAPGTGRLDRRAWSKDATDSVPDGADRAQRRTSPD
jgi:hypothetical protein